MVPVHAKLIPGHSQLPRPHRWPQAGSLCCSPCPHLSQSRLSTAPPIPDMGASGWPLPPPHQVGVPVNHHPVLRPAPTASLSSTSEPGSNSCPQSCVVLAKSLALSGPQFFPLEDGIKAICPALQKDHGRREACQSCPDVSAWLRAAASGGLGPGPPALPARPVAGRPREIPCPSEKQKEAL